MGKSIKKISRKRIISNKKSRNKFSIKNEYRESLRYIKESDNYIAIVVGVFALLFMLGFIFPYIAPKEALDPILLIVQDWVKDILTKTENLGFLGLWSFIFQNNSMVAFLSLFSGFIFGILPIIFLFSNALFVGLISGLVVNVSGISMFWRLIPHGIFELPAIFISIALGIRFGSFIFHKKPFDIFKYYFINSIRVFIFIILPLLLIASFIEAILITLLG